MLKQTMLRTAEQEETHHFTDLSFIVDYDLRLKFLPWHGQS